MVQQVKQKKRVRLKSSDKTAEAKYLRVQEEAKAAKARAKTNEEKVGYAHRLIQLYWFRVLVTVLEFSLSWRCEGRSATVPLCRPPSFPPLHGVQRLLGFRFRPLASLVQVLLYPRHDSWFLFCSFLFRPSEPRGSRSNCQHFCWDVAPRMEIQCCTWLKYNKDVPDPAAVRLIFLHALIPSIFCSSFIVFIV